MKSSNEEDRREFFRIRDRLPIEFRVLAREEFLRCEAKVRYSASLTFDIAHEVYFLREKGVGSESREERLYAYMQVLDKKLDAIIRLLSGEDGKEAFSSQYVDVDIGGAGIRFIPDTPLAEGAYVELKIVLPVFPYPKVTALCEVLRNDEGSGGEAPSGRPGETALKFLTISEKDRDCLINYIFLKEREGLRARREEIGP